MTTKEIKLITKKVEVSEEKLQLCIDEVFEIVFGFAERSLFEERNRNYKEGSTVTSA